MIQFLITREKQAGGRFENRPIDIERQEKSTRLNHFVVCGKGKNGAEKTTCLNWLPHASGQELKPRTHPNRVLVS